MLNDEETKTLDCYIKFLIKKLHTTVLDSIIVLLYLFKNQIQRFLIKQNTENLVTVYLQNKI